MMRLLPFVLVLTLLSFLVGCGDTTGAPTPPVDQWCDLERPREECELRDARIESQADMADLCKSSCSAIGVLSVFGVSAEVLKGLSGFNRIRSIAVGSLPDDVKDLTFLRGVTEIQSLAVFSNRGLESLKGLEAAEFREPCEGCSTKIRLEYNPKLRSFEGLQNVTELGSLSIEGHPNLEVIDGFDALTSTGIYISGNERLRRISGFQSLETSSRLGITINQNLERIDAFPNLTQLDSLNLDRNRKLNRCDVDRVLGQLDQAPDFVSITESGSPCSD